MTCKRYLLLTLLCFFSVLVSISSIQVMLQSFRHCNSSGIISCSLRVHKINRTTAALIGNITLNEDLGADLETSIDVQYSALGNNQFVKYPMKIGPMNFCFYLRTFWADYRDYIAGYVPNAPGVGECPVLRRTMLVNDLILDPRMFPRYVPTGLWVMLWVVKDKNGNYAQLEFLYKIFEDGYF